MKILNSHLLSATALAAGLMIAAPYALSTVHSDEAAKEAIGTTAGGAKIPTTEEARAAKLMPDDPNPVPGQDLVPATKTTDGDKPTASSGKGDPTTATGGQAAVGGPMSPGASAGGQNSNTPGGASPETIGARAVGASKDARPGPIGATGQTMPSRYSQRNEILDRVPLMAMPFAFTGEQRQRIYQTLMADTARQPTAAAETLVPAAELSAEQALNEAQPVPDSLRDIEALRGLYFVKAKNKVLLVTPATRTVRDAITL